MNERTLLHRQVHPSFCQDGRISSQAFRPTPKDHSLLSVYDGDLIGAENAWIHFTRILRFSSLGVVAVTVEECLDKNLAVRSDPEPFLEHAVIDFSGFTKAEVERKAKQLKSVAENRGWLYLEAAASSPAAGDRA